MLAPRSQTSSPQNGERERPAGEASIVVFVSAAGAKQDRVLLGHALPPTKQQKRFLLWSPAGAILLLHGLGVSALVPEPLCCVRISSHSVSTCCVFNQKQSRELPGWKPESIICSRLGFCSLPASCVILDNALYICKVRIRCLKRQSTTLYRPQRWV